MPIGWGSKSKTKVCLSHASSDEEFVEKVKGEVSPRINEFEPELLCWVCGLDAHKASYGTRKLTENCYPKLAKIIKQSSDEFCEGKLVVEFPCNAPPHVCEYVTPILVDCLAEI